MRRRVYSSVPALAAAYSIREPSPEFRRASSPFCDPSPGATWPLANAPPNQARLWRRPGFDWAVVCKRLADRENSFRKLGRANAQNAHSNGVTEYVGGNEIASCQLEGTIRVATGLSTESGQTSDFGPVSNVTTTDRQSGGHREQQKPRREDFPQPHD